MATLETRLRYVRSKDPDLFQPWLVALKHRVMIYQIQFQGGQWWLWYVPPDDMKTVPENMDLDA